MACLRWADLGVAGAWVALAAAALWAPAPRLWWGVVPAVVWCGAVGLEVRAVASWWRRGAYVSRLVAWSDGYRRVRTRARLRVSAPAGAALILAAVDAVTLAHLCTGREAWGLVHASGWVCWGAMLVLGVMQWMR